MRIDFPNVVGTIDVYMDVMRAICSDTDGKSMIDLMCCFAPNTPKLGFKTRTYVDVIDRKLDHPEEQQFFICADVKNLYRFTSHLMWDVAICSDGIEHLLKEDGLYFLTEMRQISRKQILFTPLGELFKLTDNDNKDPEAHRSAWLPEDINNEELITWGQPYACITFPDYHKGWNGGAMFFWRDDNGTEKDFDRVVKELKTKPWAI